MFFSKKPNDLPPELEVRRYFYGFTHNATTDDSMYETLSSIGYTYPKPNGTPINYNSPVSIFNKFDEDLALYLVCGVETLDVYASIEERREWKQCKIKAKQSLYK